MLPGWESLESVTRWHTFFEFGGIAVLLLLVAMEFGAYKYGHRKEELVEQMAERKQRAADAREKEASSKLAEIEEAQRPRTLTAAQREQLLRRLSTTPYLRVVIANPIGDGEAKAFASQLADILKQAKWVVVDQIQGMYGTEDPVGITINFSAKAEGRNDGHTQVAMENVPKAVFALRDALGAVGLDPLS